ncbi:MAG: molybdopterin oxidoreductase family protein [Bacteroidota bacterium]
MLDNQTQYRTCNLCEAMCGLEITLENNQIKSIKGDKKDPLSRGHICPKAVALQDIYYDPDRLKRPIKKVDGKWIEISWEDAYQEVFKNISGIQEKYGNNAIGVYLGNPNVHNVGSMLVGPDFTRSLKTKNRFSATSCDQLPHHVASLLMLGHSLLIPIPDIDRTDFLLIIGANPLVSNGSMMTSPDFAKRLRAIRKKGGKVVVVDPRKTETAKKADQHIFIQPGKDAILLLALIHTLFDEGLTELGHLEATISGLDIIETTVKPFSPEVMQEPLGISSNTIRTLAREMAKANSAVCYSRMGASTQLFGGLCQWLTNVFNILTGNFDKAGGAMFTQPAFDVIGLAKMQGRKGFFGRRKSRVSGYPSHGGEFPTAALLEEITTPGEGQIKAMVTIAGNPVLSTANGSELEEAFSQLDYMVAIDIYLNETTRLADIILPPATGLETTHYDIIFNVLAIRNTTKYSPALFEIEDYQRYDWQIFKTLTSLFNGVPENSMTPDTILSTGLQFGPYAKDGITLEKLKSEPNGIDLGPLKPCLKERLMTDDQMIQLAPEIFIEDIKRLQSTFLNSQTDQLDDLSFLLIGRRHLRSNNSWMHNALRLVKGGNRCTLLLHPEDANKLDIEDGQIVLVTSEKGQVKIPVEITTDIMPGVVSIPHGWGHNKKGIKMAVAEQHPGVSINELTDEKHIDELTGNAAFSGVKVAITVPE